MHAWVDFVRGPAFVLCFGFMVFGLAWHVGVTAWLIARTAHRAADPSLPLKAIARATLKWLLPFDKIGQQPLFTATSMLFHVAILAVPIFLAGHVALWARGAGLHWPAMPNGLADVLTIVGVITAVALPIQRAFMKATRGVTRTSDTVIPLVLAVPLVTGFLVMHPRLNPFAYESMLFVHVLSANLVFVLMPLTKLSHAALLPAAQLTAELGWHWPLDAGSKVAAALGKEAEPV